MEISFYVGAFLLFLQFVRSLSFGSGFEFLRVSPCIFSLFESIFRYFPGFLELLMNRQIDHQSLQKTETTQNSQRTSAVSAVWLTNFRFPGSAIQRSYLRRKSTTNQSTSTCTRIRLSDMTFNPFLGSKTKKNQLLLRKLCV